MAELDNLLGSRISLITQQDIRYEGILFSINQNESSIVLRDVKYFGTEDRVVEKKIPGNDAVLAFVSFPGNEIKDLYVHEGDEAAPMEEETVVTKENTLPPPPAQNNTTTPPDVPQKEKTNDNAQQQQPKPQQSQQRPQQQHRQQQPRQQQKQPSNQEQNQQRRGNGNRSKGPSTVGTGAHLLNLRERTSNGGGANLLEKTEGDFNFTEGLSSFKKDEIKAEVASQQPNADSCYKKDNFFDMLSSSAVAEEAGGQRERLTPRQERSLNEDTFGAIALQQSNRHRYGGRGRGRGGRGRGRGGGYRNNRNSNYNNSNRWNNAPVGTK